MSTPSCSSFLTCYQQGLNQLTPNLGASNQPTQTGIATAKASFQSACNFMSTVPSTVQTAVHYGVNALKSILAVQNDLISAVPTGANVTFTNIYQYDVMLAISYLATASASLYNDAGQTTSANNAILGLQSYITASQYLSALLTPGPTITTPQIQGNTNLAIAATTIASGIAALLLAPSTSLHMHKK
jgi:hypothetical protein